MPWPIGRTFGESSGNERRSTLTIAVQTRSAARSVGLVVRAGELADVDSVADRMHLRGVERKRAAVDARHRGGRPLRRPQQAAGAPVRVPEHERDAQRAHERRGEDGVDRAHVGDDRAAAQAAELRRERRFEPRAAPGPRARPEGADARVGGQRVRNGPVREDDHLVHTPRERRDLRHRRPQRRVLRVDLLRDEDEPHALQGAERSDRAHGLARHLGDHLEVPVVMAYRDAGQLRRGGHDKVVSRHLAMPSALDELSPDADGAIPYCRAHVDLGQAVGKCGEAVEFTCIPRRPEKLQLHRRTRGDLARQKPSVELRAHGVS